MATIKDVARRAGVAISTVSAVLNRSAPVSEQVIEQGRQGDRRRSATCRMARRAACEAGNRS